MKAKRLDTRLMVQKPETVRNEWGEEVATWVDVAQVWAGVEPLSLRGMANAKEANLSGAETAVGMHWITMRPLPEIRATWRVVPQSGRLQGFVMEIKDVRLPKRDEMNLIVQVLNG